MQLLQREVELNESALADATLTDAPTAAAEEFWSPALQVPDGVPFQEEYGQLSPIPSHDGTECFKWDNTLWSAADHFRVSMALSGKGHAISTG